MTKKRPKRRTPTAQQPANETAVCRCGAGPHARDPQRCRRGHPLRDNRLSLVHGARSRRVMNAGLPDMADYRDILREKEAALVVDLGGEANLAVTKRELTTRFIEASAILSFLGGNILKHGVLTTKGRQRAAVATYLQVLDRITRLALALGLERQAKQVPSIDEFLRTRQPQPPEPITHEA